MKFNQVDQEIIKLRTQYEKKNTEIIKNIELINSSHHQISILASEVQEFVSTVFQEISRLKSEGEYEAVGASLLEDALSKINKHVSDRTTILIFNLEAETRVLQALADFQESTADLRVTLTAIDKKTERIKRDILAGKDATKKTKTRKKPDSIKSVRSARSELIESGELEEILSQEGSKS